MSIFIKSAVDKLPRPDWDVLLDDALVPVVAAAELVEFEGIVDTGPPYLS